MNEDRPFDVLPYNDRDEWLVYIVSLSFYYNSNFGNGFIVERRKYVVFMCSSTRRCVARKRDGSFTLRICFPYFACQFLVSSVSILLSKEYRYGRFCAIAENIQGYLKFFIRINFFLFYI